MFGLHVINPQMISPAVHRRRCWVIYRGILEEDVCPFGQEGKHLRHDTGEFSSRQLSYPVAAPQSHPVSNW